MGMTDALEGCRKFSSRTKARGLSRAATAGGIEPIHGRQIPRMRIPNFEVTGQKKWERMEAGGGRWRHVEGKLRPKSNFFSGTKCFFRHKMWEQVKNSLLFTAILVVQRRVRTQGEHPFCFWYCLFFSQKNHSLCRYTLDIIISSTVRGNLYHLKTPPPSPLLNFSMHCNT